MPSQFDPPAFIVDALRCAAELEQKIPLKLKGLRQHRYVDPAGRDVIETYAAFEPADPAPNS